jgi:hypothetical protein
MRRAWLLGLVVLAGAACAGPDTDGGYGRLRVALRKGDFFKLKILRTAPSESLQGELAFQTPCTEAQSGTFELKNMPTGDAMWLVLESFGSSTCVADKRIDMGYRGGVAIGGDPTPHYHVPLYAVHAISPLPEDINISASEAIAVQYCESASQCSQYGPSFGCYEDLPQGRAQPSYYCLPVCAADADCTAFHKRAVCSQGFCVLHQPFPLNMSEPRALGVAAALESGGVALMGGFGDTEEGRLVPTKRPVEVFDAPTGLFREVSLQGLEGWGAALFGFAPLGGDRFAVVGGAHAWRPSYSIAQGSLALSFDDLAKDYCAPGAACVPNARQEVYVIDFKAGTVIETSLPKGVIAPIVLPRANGTFVVAGGFAKDGTVMVGIKTTYQCSDDGVVATCTELETQLTQGRGGAAVACLNTVCDSWLVVGGNLEGTGAEIADLSTEQPAFKQLSVTGLPTSLLWPTLCGLTLVGGAVPAGQVLTPSGLKVEVPQLTAQPVAGTPGGSLLPSAVATSATDCWVGGGVQPDGTVVTSAYTLQAAAVGPDQPVFSKPRFGMQAARIGSGPLTGAVLFSGGLRLVPDDDRVDFVRGAEVLWP